MSHTEMIPEELSSELNALKQMGHDIDVKEEDKKIYLISKNYLLPKNLYNKSTTDLLIFTTPNYPNAGFDMFWVDEDLLLKNGSVPRSSESIEPHLGKKWRRFSYHPYNKKPWNPSDDSSISFLGYVKQRLQKGD